MWQSSKGSVSAPTMASTVTPSRIRWPHRSPGSQYWPRRPRLPCWRGVNALGPPAPGSVRVPELDGRRRRYDRLQPAAAEPVHGECGGGDRQAAVDGGDPAEIHVPGLGVDHVAEDRMAD